MDTLTVANWKMNGNIKEWKKLATSAAFDMKNLNTHVVLATPSPAFYFVSNIINKSNNVCLAAQDIHFEDNGAHTGNISALMLKDFNGKFTLIGHSERRDENHETDELLNKKIKQAIRHNICPIFCIGESLHERKNNKTIEKLDEQLQDGLNDINISSSDDLVIAYEPVWAISSSTGSLGREPSDEELEEVFTHLRNVLIERFANMGNNIKLLYGGSVKPENTEKIMKNINISGVLVGGASLKADVFVEIAKKVAATN